MNKGAAVVGGVGLGAALMYFFDPDRGKRRRAMVRDKVEAAGNKVGTYAGKMSRDIRNRAYGFATETKSLFQHEEVSDDVLVNRVRAKLGRYSAAISAIDVAARDGVVTLTGSVGAEELPKVLRATHYVRGVKDINNQLQVQAEGDGAPSFQKTPQPLGA